MDYSAYFDIPNEIIYFNTPGNGLMPRSHHAWRSQRESEFFDVGGDLRDQQPAFMANVKKHLGELFHCSASNLFLTPNFSFGLNTLLDGLPSGLKYAILDEDYPSLNYPVISRQFDYKLIKVDATLEENILDCIAQNNVDVLLLSIVQYINGLKVDFDFIKKLRVQYPDLIIIGDATQYMGTEPFDFNRSGFDAVGGSGYKWMMAGFGNGYMMISDDLKDMLYKPAQRGPRPKEAMWSSKSILDTFFEPGHQDTLSHGTLLQSVHFLNNLGLDNIQRHLQRLTQYTYDHLEERSLLLPEIKNREARSSLINVQIDPSKYELLMARGIKCFPRGTGIRIGVHLHNTEADINALLAVIDKI